MNRAAGRVQARAQPRPCEGSWHADKIGANICAYDVGESIAFKAELIELKLEMPAAEAFRTIARACIAHFHLNVRLLIASRSAEPLHQARVAIRRVRSALSLFKLVARDQEYERFKRGLRDISHKLGEARDLDVYIARIADDNVGESGNWPPFAPDTAGRVQAERECAYQRVTSALQSKRFHQFMLDFAAWIATGPWCARNGSGRKAAREQAIGNFATRLLDRRWRTVKRRGRHLDRLSPEERHLIRIDVKKLRYASEFFSTLVADRKRVRRHKQFVSALEDLQAGLGDLNDIQTEHEILARLLRPEAASAKRLDALRAAKPHPDGRDTHAAVLLGSTSKAYRQLLDTRPFWKS